MIKHLLHRATVALLIPCLILSDAQVWGNRSSSFVPRGIPSFSEQAVVAPSITSRLVKAATICLVLTTAGQLRVTAVSSSSSALSVRPIRHPMKIDFKSILANMYAVQLVSSLREEMKGNKFYEHLDVNKLAKIREAAEEGILSQEAMKAIWDAIPEKSVYRYVDPRATRLYRHETPIGGAAYRYALRDGHDPLLLLAMIHAESRFDPTAKSRKGALGPLQLNPDTARAELKKRGVLEIRDEDLMHVDLNIDLASAYFKKLRIQLNDQSASLAAYNAGIKNEEIWRAGQETLDIHRITFRETREYIDLVSRTYEQLKTLEIIGRHHFVQFSPVLPVASPAATRKLPAIMAHAWNDESYDGMPRSRTMREESIGFRPRFGTYALNSDPGAAGSGKNVELKNLIADVFVQRYVNLRRILGNPTRLLLTMQFNETDRSLLSYSIPWKPFFKLLFENTYMKAAAGEDFRMTVYAGTSAYGDYFLIRYKGDSKAAWLDQVKTLILGDTEHPSVELKFYQEEEKAIVRILFAPTPLIHIAPPDHKVPRLIRFTLSAPLRIFALVMAILTGWGAYIHLNKPPHAWSMRQPFSDQKRNEQPARSDPGSVTEQDLQKARKQEAQCKKNQDDPLPLLGTRRAIVEALRDQLNKNLIPPEIVEQVGQFLTEYDRADQKNAELNKVGADIYWRISNYPVGDDTVEKIRADLIEFPHALVADDRGTLLPLSFLKVPKRLENVLGPQNNATKEKILKTVYEQSWKKWGDRMLKFATHKNVNLAFLPPKELNYVPFTAGTLFGHDWWQIYLLAPLVEEAVRSALYWYMVVHRNGFSEGLFLTSNILYILLHFSANRAEYKKKYSERYGPYREATRWEIIQGTFSAPLIVSLVNNSILAIFGDHSFFRMLYVWCANDIWHLLINGITSQTVATGATLVPKKENGLQKVENKGIEHSPPEEFREQLFHAALIALGEPTRDPQGKLTYGLLGELYKAAREVIEEQPAMGELADEDGTFLVFPQALRHPTTIDAYAFLISLAEGKEVEDMPHYAKQLILKTRLHEYVEFSLRPLVREKIITKNQAHCVAQYVEDSRERGWLNDSNEEEYEMGLEVLTQLRRKMNVQVYKIIKDIETYINHRELQPPADFYMTGDKSDPTKTEEDFMMVTGKYLLQESKNKKEAAQYNGFGLIHTNGRFWRESTPFTPEIVPTPEERKIKSAA